MNHRLKRVNSLLLKEVNKVVQQKVGDPRVGFVTLTGVKVSPDLRTAKVFVASSRDEEKDRKTLKALNHASAYITGELGRNVVLRYTPECKFFIDKTLESAERIEAIIESLHQNDEGIDD